MVMQPGFWPLPKSRARGGISLTYLGDQRWHRASSALQSQALALISLPYVNTSTFLSAFKITCLPNPSAEQLLWRSSLVSLHEDNSAWSELFLSFIRRLCLADEPCILLNAVSFCLPHYASQGPKERTPRWMKPQLSTPVREGPGWPKSASLPTKANDTVVKSLDNNWIKKEKIKICFRISLETDKSKWHKQIPKS